jgi:hypothetical protein
MIKVIVFKIGLYYFWHYIFNVSCNIVLIWHNSHVQAKYERGERSLTCCKYSIAGLPGIIRLIDRTNLINYEKMLRTRL